MIRMIFLFLLPMVNADPRGAVSVHIDMNVNISKKHPEIESDTCTSHTFPPGLWIASGAPGAPSCADFGAVPTNISGSDGECYTFCQLQVEQKTRFFAWFWEALINIFEQINPDPDPATAAPATIASTTIIKTIKPTTKPNSEDVTWSTVKNACIKGNNDKIYQPVTIDECKEKCIEEPGIKCQSIEYSKSQKMCSLSETRSDSDDYLEPCSVNGWVFAEIELKAVPTTVAPATTALSITTTNGVSCNLVWDSEGFRPLIMLRESRVIIPPIMDTDISNDPNRISVGVKMVFACPGENNEFNFVNGSQSKLHGECMSEDQIKVCVNNYPEIMDLSQLSCSNQMHPTIIKQENDAPYKKNCEDVGGELYKIGYIYGDFKEFKDLQTKICFRDENQTTLWTSADCNSIEISPSLRYKNPLIFRTAQGFARSTFYSQKSQQETIKGLLDKEVRSLWNDLACRDHGGHCVRGGNLCPEHLTYQTSQGEPYCTSFYRCCYSEPCAPTTCTYKGQPGNCGLDSSPGTIGVGGQECKKGCQCFINDNMILSKFKSLLDERELSKLLKVTKKRCKDICPPKDNPQFPRHYVCTTCKTEAEANDFMNTGVTKPSDDPYYLLSGKTYGGADISLVIYTDIIDGKDKCQVEKEVQIWRCVKPVATWNCITQGYCTVEILRKLGRLKYKPVENSLKCPCPNDVRFLDYHICTDCKSNRDADKFMTLGPDDRPHVKTIVLGGKTYDGTAISYTPDPGTENCMIAEAVQIWSCEWERITDVDNSPYKWFCTSKEFSAAQIDGDGGVNEIVQNSITNACYNENFDDDHVCRRDNGGKFCTTEPHANRFMKDITQDNNPYYIYGKDGFGNGIVYTRDGGICKIKTPVMTWRCNWVNGEPGEPGEWSCTVEEKYCTVNINAPNIPDCQCATKAIIDKYVPLNDLIAWQFVLSKNVPLTVASYPVFNNKDFDGSMISFELGVGARCIISKTVNIWICTPTVNLLGEVEWQANSCKLQGYSTAMTDSTTGLFIQGSVQTDCPNPNFLEKHVCTACKSEIQAFEYTKKNRSPGSTDTNTVFAGSPALQYQLIDQNSPNPPARPECKITSPETIKAWEVTTWGDPAKWVTVMNIGSCLGLTSVLDSGHLMFGDAKCYQVIPASFWSNAACGELDASMLNPDTPDNCRKECSDNPNCNAFNYKFGESCILMECPIPFPDSDPNEDGYKAYYKFPGYKVHQQMVWADAGDGRCEPIEVVRPIPDPGTPAVCGQRCTEKENCNAFNHEVGLTCDLKKCPLPYPVPVAGVATGGAYYRF